MISEMLVAVVEVLRSSARRIGRPTMEGKTWAGKLDPPYPHLTNWSQQRE